MGTAAGGGGVGGASDGGALPFESCGTIDEFASGPFVPWFEDATATSGVQVTGEEAPQTIGNGVAVGDLDGDGLQDLVATSGRNTSTRVYRNLGDLTFKDVTDDLCQAPLLHGYSVGLPDLDNDGDPDVVITGESLIAVYRNEGGQLTDVTAGSGLAVPVRTPGLVAGDFDGDGLLDLYTIAKDGRMFHNLGDLHFEDVTAAWKVTALAGQNRWTGSVLDYDGDGALDLYVQMDTDVADPDLGEPLPDPYPAASVFGDHLFHNDGWVNGVLRFTRKEVDAGLAVPRSSMGTVVADFDGDGALDLYASNMGRNPLFHNEGNGTYKDVGDPYGIGTTRRFSPVCPSDTPDRFCLLHTWGSALFDADHDGIDDLLLVNGIAGWGDHQLQPSSQFRGKPDGTFTQVETAIGCMNGRALVPADFDGDGDLDLAITTVAAPVRIFRNNAPEGKGWVRVVLRGTSSNRDGIGAIVTATLSGGRKVIRAVGTGGVAFGWSPVEAHFVTGGVAVSGLDVKWPSGKTQHVDAVPLNQVLTVEEP